MFASGMKFSFRSSARQTARLNLMEKAGAGVVTWKPHKHTPKNPSIFDELNFLCEKLAEWEDQEKRMIIFENCELLFQDLETGTSKCWLENLGVLHDYDLNEIEEIIYQGHSLVNQVFQLTVPSVYIKRQPTFGYGMSLSGAATICLDASKPAKNVHIGHFQAPGMSFFADWKEKLDVLSSELKPIQARLMRASHHGHEDVHNAIEKLVIQYPGTKLIQSDFHRYSPTSSLGCTNMQLTEALGSEYRSSLETLEDKKRSAFDSFQGSQNSSYFSGLFY